MPRTGPRRKMVGTKLSDDERDAVDQRAFREGVTIRGGEANTSEMIRIMCAYAAEHMPEGWRPVAREDVTA